MADLGPILADLGPILADLGPILSDLGPILAHTGCPWPHLGSCWPHLGLILAHLGLILAHLDHILTSCWPQVAFIFIISAVEQRLSLIIANFSLESPDFRIPTCFRPFSASHWPLSSSFLGPSWASLEAILASCEIEGPSKRQENGRNGFEQLGQPLRTSTLQGTFSKS